MTDDVPTLAYARQPRKRGRLALIAALLLAGIATYAVWRWYVPHFRRYLAQRRLDAMVPPAGAILFSEEPADIARLGNSTDYTTQRFGPNKYVDWSWGGPGFDHMPAVSRLGPLPTPTGGSYLCPAHTNLITTKTPIGRRTAGGVERMIYAETYTVMRNGQADGSGFMTLPAWEVSNVVTLWSGRPVEIIRRGAVAIELYKEDRLVLFTPTLDPIDLSHLSFDYTINGEHGVIDGWLLPNDHMAFSLTSGQANTWRNFGYVTSKP